MKRQSIVLSVCLFVGLFTCVASALDTRDVWSFVDSAVSKSPEVSAKESEARRNIEISKSLSHPENPIVEFGWTNRTATGPNSSVAAWGLRQKLPFWTTRTRQADVQRALGEAAKWETEATIRQMTLELIRRIYAVGRLEAEQDHMKDRRARFALIKAALERTRAASPGQKIERRLIQSAVAIVEGQFDQIEASVRSERSLLNLLGPVKIETLQLKWLAATELLDLSNSFKNLKPKRDPLLFKADELVKAANFEVQATAARPEFEVFLQSDKETGAAKEQNFTAGVSATLPFSALWGGDRRAAELNRTKTESHRLSTTRAFEQVTAKTLVTLQAATKSLERFPLANVQKIDAEVKEAEGQVRQSWITVSQFLEFDRQAHAQIEEIYNAQERAVDAIINVCTVFDCDVRALLGGSI